MAYVQVYTGNGKGKTTAAIGLIIRALGAGKRVLFLQFMKERAYSEHKILPGISNLLIQESIGKPFFIAKKGEIPPEVLSSYGDACVVFEKGHPPKEYVEKIDAGMELARAAVSSGSYDLVVLDEINCAMFFELVSVEAVIELLEKRALNTEVVLTGRNAPQQIVDYADLVTEMKEIKHYYSKGVKARRGIEN